jgi:hypothetical protein
MDTEAVIERQRRIGRPAGIVGLVAIGILFGSQFISVGDVANDNSAVSLAAVAENSGALLAAAILGAIGQLMFAAPLYAMFDAAQRRSDTMRRGLIGLAIAGPIFAAVGSIVGFIALDSAADAFLDPDNGYDLSSEADADDALEGVGIRQLVLGLGSAAGISLVITLIYVGLNAMRVGLLTRFWGTLTMALGVALLLPGFTFISLPIVIGVFSLLLANIWPGSRPPAWEAGVAMPWPKGGGGPVEEPSPDEGEELARPEDFDGSGRELEPEASPQPDEGPAPADDGPRKRKRKQRD